MGYSITHKRVKLGYVWSFFSWQLYRICCIASDIILLIFWDACLLFCFFRNRYFATKSLFRDNMTTEWVEYLADIAVEEDEFSEAESFTEGEETSWRFMNNDEANVELQDDVIDLKLLRVLKEEMEVIFGRISSKIDMQKDIMNEVVRIFVDPVLNSWTAAANAGRNENTPLLSPQDVCEFIRTLAFLSTYKETPTEFFASVDRYPASVTCSEIAFKRVLNGFSNGKQESKWFEAHRTCADIIECEKMCNTVNAQNAYVPRATILSKDDDQYRLRSRKCEDIGLVRVNNPKKAYGPVTTGCVSLVTSITLSAHIAGPGESALDVAKIVMMHLTNCQLPEQVKGRNIIAMDRGYWGPEMIGYMSNCGFQLIGTHKRIKSYPFTFGEKRPKPGQKHIKEKGAKGVYWAEKKQHGVDTYALAYRDGKGHVATLFTTIRDTPLYAFQYIWKVEKIAANESRDISIEREMYL